MKMKTLASARSLVAALAASAALAVRADLAPWFDAGVSGYANWPSDGSDKLVVGQGTWSGTSSASLATGEGGSAPLLRVTDYGMDGIEFQSCVRKDLDISANIAFNATVCLGCVKTLPTPTDDAKGGVVVYDAGDGEAYYGLAYDATTGSNGWKRLEGAVSAPAEEFVVKMSLRSVGGEKQIRYEVGGNELRPVGASDGWMRIDAGDGVVRGVEMFGHGTFSSLSGEAPDDTETVRLSFPGSMSGVTPAVSVGGVPVAESATEPGVYEVARGSVVDVTFSAEPGHAVAGAASAQTYVLFEDSAVPPGDVPKTVNVAEAVRINEVMASNGSSAATENGGAELDWIELYNGGSVDVDLTGWFVNDSDTKPSKWVPILGSCIVPANGYKIVWCDKSYTNWVSCEAYARFGIGKSGGTLVLADAQASDRIVSSMPFPAQMKDVSYGWGCREEPVLASTAPAQYRVGASGAWKDCEGPLGMPGATNGFTITSYKLDANAAANISAVEAALASGAFVPVLSTNVETIAYSNANKNVITSPQFGPYYKHVGTLGPGVITGSYYAFLVEGSIWIPRAGDWTFSVGSDDGFSLKIYNEKYSFTSEFPNGRSYGQTPAIFRVLEPGAFKVRLLYFQGTGSAALDFSVKEGAFDDYETFSLDGFQLVGLPESGVTHAGAWACHALNDVSGEMLGVSDTLEWRTTLSLANAPVAGDVCRLKVRYADGFTVKVNGSVVAQVVPAGQRPLAEAVVPQVVEFPATALSAGDNAIEVTAVNDSAGSAEFLLGIEAFLTKSAEELVYFREPTPLAMNTTAGYGPASPKVAFSVPHGWKTAAFDLELSCPDDGEAEIYYTLDGTSPTTNSTRYTEAIHVSSTTCVRAAVPREGSVIQQDASATYLFLDDILAQARGVVPDGFPANKAINDQAMMYGMNQSVVNGAERDRILRGFTNSVATLSIVIDPANLFNSTTGIYVNAVACDGREWERLTMVEQIDPKDPANGFSTAAGIRIRGAFSRNPKYPKHSLRLFFRNDYGDGPLEFPLFGDEGAGKFKKIDLRTSQNYAWANGYVPDTFIHEVFSRDTQRDMGEYYTRSRYYNLFINGQYWGLYQTQERGDEDYAETYNGGDADLYDVIKTSQPGYVTGASEGTIDAWEALWNIAVNEGFSGTHVNNYRRAMGQNPDGTRNPDYPVYLNPTNLMDFILDFHFVVDSDSPASRGNHPNNLYAVRDRNDDDDGLKTQGFYFLRHDAEHSMGENTTYTKYTDDPTGYGTTVQSANFTKSENFNPAELHWKLCENEEYRMAFADRFYYHCLREGGALTVAKATERFTSRMAEIDDVIVCEAARWATKGQTRQTWIDACTNCLSFITNRMPYMLAQYRARGWYPSVAVPAAFAADGTRVTEGMLLPDGLTVLLKNSESGAAYGSGTVYYTLDRSDPRAADGSVAEGALVCGAAGFELPAGGAFVTTRYLSAAGEWSALGVAPLVAEVASEQVQGVRVAAVYSNTADGGGDGSEFIVLTNLLNRAVSLKGLKILCIKDGNAESDASLALTLGDGDEIAANGTFTLNKSERWPELNDKGKPVQKITNGAVDMKVYDSVDAVVQTLHFEAAWWDNACKGTGTYFVAKDFGGTVTDIAQWKPSESWVEKSLRFFEFDGITADGASGDTGEYFVLTNLSASVTLDLSGVKAIIGKAAEMLADETKAKCIVTIPADTALAPGTSIRFDQATYWPGSKQKITNGDLILKIYDAEGATVQTSAVSQSTFTRYYGSGGPGGTPSLRATSFERTTANSDWREYLPPLTDWPDDPDTEITSETTAAELAIISGSFANATPVELRKLSKWAKRNGVPYGGVAVNSMSFDEDGRAGSEFEEAYLLNCAPGEVDAKKALFRFGEIVPGVVPEIDGTLYNGRVRVFGSATLENGGTWSEDDLASAHFYKAYLTR